MKLKSIALLPALLGSFLVQADYLQALDAYNAKQLNEARQLFLQAAELGDAKAQRILSTMLAKGEGGPVNAIDAYAWAALAALENDTTAAKIRDAIGAQLPAEIKKQADARVEAFKERHSSEGVKNYWMPVLNSAEPSIYDLQFPLAVLRNGLPVEYPKKAAEASDQGIICASFYLSDSGQPLGVKAFNPWAARSHLASATEKQLQNWRFSPTAEKDERSAFCIDYLIEGPTTFKASDEAERQLSLAGTNRASLRSVAASLTDAGRASYQRIEIRVAVDAYARLALQGDAEAAFQLASFLWRGEGCRQDRPKALRWMDLAARNGYSEAMAFLALNPSAVRELKLDDATQKRYLQQAADSGHQLARYRVAVGHLQSKDTQRWATGLSMLQGLDDSTTIKALDWRAYGLALAGDFDSALDTAEEALDLAKEYGLSTVTREQAFASLQNAQRPKEPTP